MLLRLFCLSFLAPLAAFTQPNTSRIVLQTSTILDGKGSVLRNQQIVIEGSRIQSVQAGTLPATYDLRGLTVAAPDAMPSGSARASRMTRPEALTMGVRTGEEKHKLIIAELANHGHGTNESQHVHNNALHSHTPLRGKFAVTDNSFDGPIGTLNAYLAADPAHTLWFDQNTEQGNSGTVFGATTGLTIQNNGGDGVHENVQPTIFVPYIVKLDD